MSQSEQFHEAWAYLRDNAKPVQPHDVYDLRVVREQTPPSKAHVRRLLKDRPLISINRPKPPADVTARVRQIEAVNYGLKIRKMLQPNKFAPPAPTGRPRPAPHLVKAVAVAEGDPQAGSKRLRRQHILAMCKMVFNPYVPKEEDVLWAFGSWEAFEKARETA